MALLLGDILKTVKFTVTCACGNSIEWDFSQPRLVCKNCGLNYNPNGEENLLRKMRIKPSYVAIF